jgi:signal transduction histidine kinase
MSAVLSAQPPSSFIADGREPSRPHDRTFDVALLLLLLAVIGLTVAVIANPAVAPATFNPRLDVVVTTCATLATAAATVLGWGRFREGRNPAALFRGSAFGVLFVYNALTLGVTLLGLDVAFGAALDRPGQLPLWSGLVSRLIAAGLLVVAGVAGLRVTRRLPRRALLVLGLPSVMILAAYVFGAALQGDLPELIGPVGLAQLQAQPDQPLVRDVSLGLVVGQALIGFGFLVAAFLAYVVYQRERRGADACLAIGLVLASFGQLHSVIHPGSYAGLVTTGDALRVAFYGSLLVAVVVESWTDIRALREASATIRRLNEAELAHATQSERARLAREIHDGLAQDLWYAKLKQGRLLALPPGAPESFGLASEVADALDAALADARQAVMALRPSDGGSFGEVLQRYVEDFGDRFGILADCSVEPMLTEPSARAQAEVLRIVQEALNNVRKHADATVVHVVARPTSGGVAISVTDNGCGFDPSTVGGSGYGLRSMEERARIVGATLTIHSQPSDGTRVLVTIPLAAR